jgi:hypothetical protein
MPDNHYIYQKLSEITNITQSAVDYELHEMQGLMNEIAQEQQLRLFIECHRGNLIITEAELHHQRVSMQIFLHDPNITKRDKIISLALCGRDFLLTKVLLSLKIKTATPWLLSQVNEIIANFNIIADPNFNNGLYVDPEFLEYVAINAWGLGEFWIIKAIADLNFHFHNSIALKKIIEQARQTEFPHILEKLYLLIEPSTNNLHKKTNKFIKDIKEKLYEILNNQTIPHEKKISDFIRNSTKILFVIAQENIKRKIITTESNITQQTLTMLSHLLRQDLDNNITNEGIQCLHHSAMHLCEPWIIDIMIKYELIALPNIHVQQVIDNQTVYPETILDTADTLEETQNTNTLQSQSEPAEFLPINVTEVECKPIALPNTHVQQVVDNQTVYPETILDAEDTLKETQNTDTLQSQSESADVLPINAAKTAQTETTQVTVDEPQIESINVTANEQKQEEPEQLKVGNQEQIELEIEKAIEERMRKKHEKAQHDAAKKALKKDKQKAARELKKKDKAQLPTIQKDSRELPSILKKKQQISIEEKLTKATQAFDDKTINTILNEHPQHTKLFEKTLTESLRKNHNITQEFIDKTPISIHLCSMLIISTKIIDKTKLLLINKITSSEIKTEDLFLANKIFNIFFRVADLCKKYPNDVTVDNKRAIIEKGLECTKTITDKNDDALHYFMRYTPNDFDALDILLLEYEKTITAITKKSAQVIPIHAINNKRQNFLHVLMEHESIETIIKTLKHLLSRESLAISSTAIFKDINNQTPINILEAKNTYDLYTEEAICLLEKIMTKVIFEIAYKNSRISKEELSMVADIYNNQSPGNIFTKLFDENKFNEIQQIIARRCSFRDNILNQLSRTRLDIMALGTIRALLSHNEYNSVKIHDSYLINTMLNLIANNKSPNIYGIQHFEDGLRQQPLTKSVVWFNMLPEISYSGYNDLDKIYDDLSEYIELSKVNPNMVDLDGLNLLDKFLRIGGQQPNITTNIQGLKLCCERLSIVVTEHHLLKQVKGLYNNGKYAYETLQYLLSKFDRKKAFKIAEDEHRDLLIHATLDGKNTAMIKYLIEYGFRPNKKYPPAMCNMLSIILNQYRFGLIQGEQALELLNACLDDQLVHKQLQLEMINSTDKHGLTPIIYLMATPETSAHDDRKIFDFLYSKGACLFTSFNEPYYSKYSFCQLIKDIKNSAICLHTFELIENKNPEFIHELLHRKQPLGKTVLDELRCMNDISEHSKKVIQYFEAYLAKRSSLRARLN